MTGEEETFLSVGLVIEKQQFDSFNEVQLSKEAKEELMTRCGLLVRNGQERPGVEAGAAMALEHWLKAHYVLECTYAGDPVNAPKKLGFYLWEDGITLVREDKAQYRLLYLPGLKMAMGALADALWECGETEETQCLTLEQEAKDLQALNAVLKENGVDVPESTGIEAHLTGFCGSEAKVHFIIKNVSGRAWLCQYGQGYVCCGYFTRADLVNQAGQWLIRAHRQEIMAVLERRRDPDESY